MLAINDWLQGNLAFLGGDAIFFGILILAPRIWKNQWQKWFGS